MTPKQFQKFMDRDQGCLHCGEVEAVAPNHRINRGMGGSNERHRPANIVVLCSIFNGFIEANADAAEVAKRYGWKLAAWDDPEKEPVFDLMTGKWWILDNAYGRSESKAIARVYKNEQAINQS